MVYLIFLVSALAIIFAGYLLAFFGDVLARRTGLGAVWFGAVFIALATSLPELVTDVSAVRQGSINLALGDIFGSNMANMAILGSVTLIFPTRRLLQRVALENVLTGGVAIALTAATVLFLSLKSDVSIGFLGLGPPLVFISYLVATFSLRERQGAAEEEEREFQGEVPLGTAAIGFTLTAGVILVAGPFLADSAAEIADKTGVGQTFFGTLLVAAVTSLPEGAVAISAMRLGAFNLVISNVMGSNATNMAMIVFFDLAYTKGNLLHAANPAIGLAGMASILLMAVAVTAIVLRAERRRLPFDVAAVVILVGYVIGMAAVYDAAH